MDQLYSSAPLTGDSSDVSDYALMKQAYINEQAAPELLPYRDDLVERMTQHIHDQEQRLDTLTEEGNHELARTLLDWQVSRARFLVRRYLRARLLKIQSNAAFVLDSPEHTARLSERERAFAKEYFLITAQYLDDTVLEQLPDAFRSLVRQQAGTPAKDMVTPFDASRPVLFRVVAARSGVDADERGEESVDLDEGDQVMMRYSLVQQLLQEGAVELM